MARLKDRIGSSGYFDAAGRTAARTGLKVPETGFFGREFDVQDLGRLARGAQSTYDVVQDVFDTGIKPVVQKLDQLSKEAGVKRAKKRIKAQAAERLKQKESTPAVPTEVVEQSVQEQAVVEKPITPQVEQDAPPAPVLGGMAERISNFFRADSRLDAAKEKADQLRTRVDNAAAGEKLRAREGLEPEYTAEERQAIVDEAVQAEKELAQLIQLSQESKAEAQIGDRKLLRQAAEMRMREIDRGKAGMESIRQMPQDIMSFFSQKEAAPPAATPAPRQQTGTVSPTGTAVTPLQARTATPQAAPQARSFAGADAAAERFLQEQAGFKPQSAADYMTVQQAKRPIAAPKVPAFYREMLDRDPEEAASLMQKADLYAMARGATQADWPKISEIAREVIGRDSSRLFEVIPYTTELEKIYKLIPKPGAQPGVDIDLKGAVSMRKDLADARLKESKAAKAERWKGATKNVNRKKFPIDAYKDFMRSQDLSKRDGVTSLYLTLPMQIDQLMTVTAPVPGFNKPFSQLNEKERLQFLPKLNKAAEVIARSDDLRDEKGKPIRSIGQLMKLARGGEENRAQPAQRDVSKPAYSAAKKALKRIDDRIEEHKKKIKAAENKLGPEPEVMVLTRDNAKKYMARSKEQSAWATRQKQLGPEITRLKNALITLINQKTKPQKTADTYEAQE